MLPVRFVPSRSHTIAANRLRWKTNGETTENRESCCGAKMSTCIKFFDVILLPFAVCHHICVWCVPSSFHFNSNTHLSFLFYLFALFSFILARSSLLSHSLNILRGRIRSHSLMALLQLQRRPLYKFIHNSNLSKNINIRLKRLTLCFVSLCSFRWAHGCRWALERASRSCCYCVCLIFVVIFS